MGRLKKSFSDVNYISLDLNEANIQTIFNSCLATIKTPDSDIQYSTLFKKNMGYDEDSKPMVFCKSKLAQNKKNILYLLGQLYSVHQGSREISSQNSILKYDGHQWTSDTVTLMKLYHLSEVTQSISPFIRKYNIANTNPIVQPTISPLDPNFPAWWEEHKAEWEEPKKAGQEPADD